MNKHTAALLEKHFDTAFAAPNGIAKLRELILTLAMQGKLVEQDPNDQPASELLKDIEAEKQRLIKEKKIKKPKTLPEITADELPYKLPNGWEWVRLNNIGLINPKNDMPDSKTAGFVPMSLIYEGYSTDHEFEKRLWGEIKKGYTHFADGDVGMAKITPCFENRKSCIFSGLPNGIGSGTTELHVFRNSYNAVVPLYLLYFLKSTPFMYEAIASMTGSAGHKRVPTPHFAGQIFPLPPTNEQHRIVAKINELMTRCDKLEQLRAEQEQKRVDVHQAVIQQLLNEPESNAWGFIQQHFNELYSVQENVEELRKAILQLAVMGHLVPSKEETEAKYLKDLTTKIGSGSTPTGGKAAYKESGIPLIRSMNVHFEGFKYEGLAFIDDKQAERLKGVYIFEKDVLLNITGASIGRVTLAPKDMEGARVNQHVCILRTTEKILPEYLQIYLASPLIQNLIQAIQTGATREALTKTMIEKFEIKLPSLQAQKAAVSKANELMALCVQLENQIDLATAKQTELLDAVLAGV